MNYHLTDSRWVLVSFLIMVVFVALVLLKVKILVEKIFYFVLLDHKRWSVELAISVICWKYLIEFIGESKLKESYSLYMGHILIFCILLKWTDFVRGLISNMC